MEETALNVSEEAKTESRIDLALVEKLTKQLDDFNEELKTKVYPVGIKDQAVLDRLKAFIEEGAEWSNMQALGIIELSKSLEKAEIKNDNIMLKALEIDAINFFLNKATGKGLKSAVAHIELAKPASMALKIVKLDTEKMQRMESELAAAENGIEIAKLPEETTEA